MPHRHTWVWIVALTLVLLATSPPIRAHGSPPPRSFVEPSPDGEYVFVMLAPGSVEEEGWDGAEDMIAAVREVRRTYPRSGLYRRHATRPLWTVDWHAQSVGVAADGIHLVRHGPVVGLPADHDGSLDAVLDEEAVSFFAAGRLLRTYSIGELVSVRHVPRGAVHFTWLAEGRIDHEGLAYHLLTKDGSRFVFDLRSGETVSESRADGPAWWLAAGVSTAAAAAWLAVRVRVRARPATR